MAIRTVLVASFVLLGLSAKGASLYKKALPQKKSLYQTSGVVIGGDSGSEFTLLNVRRMQSPKKPMERIVIDLGDKNGKPLRNRVSFYHVSIEKSPPRIVIDLNQISRSKVNENGLSKLFQKSPLVKSAELTSDPEDFVTKMVLNLKAPVAAEVFEMPSATKPSRVVIDIKAIR